jgi:reactive intermediate/imine deaminase
MTTTTTMTMTMNPTRATRICGALLFASALAGCVTTPQPPVVEFFRDPGSRLPFSSAVRVGDVVYLSGAIGATADNRIPEGIEAQSRAAMDNLAASAKMAGVSMDSVFKCLVMLDDMSQWGAFNAVYATYFKPERLPARSAFGADGLALGATLEVECMAVAPAGRTRATR